MKLSEELNIGGYMNSYFYLEIYGVYKHSLQHCLLMLRKNIADKKSLSLSYVPEVVIPMKKKLEKIEEEIDESYYGKSDVDGKFDITGVNCKKEQMSNFFIQDQDNIDNGDLNKSRFNTDMNSDRKNLVYNLNEEA